MALRCVVATVAFVLVDLPLPRAAAPRSLHLKSELNPRGGPHDDDRILQPHEPRHEEPSHQDHGSRHAIEVDNHGYGDFEGQHSKPGEGILDSHVDQGAPSVAIGLLAAAVLIPVVLLMALSKDKVLSLLTFKMLDVFTAIFLAVLWFNASSDVLAIRGFKDAFPCAEEVFAVLLMVLFYVVAVSVAYYCRDNEKTLVTFTSVMAHYISFCGIRAMGETQHLTQHAAGHQVSHAAQPFVSLTFVLVFFFALASLSLASHVLFRSKVEHAAFNEAVEELELDVVGLTVSFGLTQALRHFLTGHYPASAHLLLLENPHRQHEAWQRSAMLAYALGLTVLMAFSLEPLEHRRLQAEERKDLNTARLLHVLRTTLSMCVAWGYLLYAEWEFQEVLFHGDPMFGHMVFAVFVTVVALAIVALLSKINYRRPQAIKAASVSITAVSLMAAWSWEHCYDMAIDVIGDVYSVGYDGLVPKILLAILLPCVILPVYFMHLKPMLLEKTEEMKHHHGRDEEEAIGAREAFID